MDFDFDIPVDRQGTHSLRWEKYAGRDVIPLWVADMDFRSPPAVIDALRRRVEHGVYGYTLPPPELSALIVERMQRLYRWAVHPAWIVFLPGVVSGLYLAASRLTRVGEHAQEIALKLRAKKILVRDWSYDPHLKGYLRFTIGSQAQTRRLTTELHRLRDLIQTPDGARAWENMVAYNSTGWVS